MPDQTKVLTENGSKQGSRQLGDPRQLSVDELDNVAGGHSASPPPPGFDSLEQIQGSSTASKANWGRVAQQIDAHNVKITK